MRRVGACVLVAAALAQTWTPRTASAQDLFELAVFPYETVNPGQTTAELHSNVLPPRAGGTGSQASEPSHYPLHVSMEIAHGWTPRFETGVFVETAPLASGRAEQFAGGHVRLQWRVIDSPRLPFRVGASAEYEFNRLQFDVDRQVLGIRSILERQQGRLYLVLNPTLEFVAKGPPSESRHSTGISGKFEWAVKPTVSLGAEYYSTGPLKHFEPTADHHFVIPTIDVHASPLWDIDLGAGHGLGRLNEPWILKVVVGHRFGAED